MAELWLMLFLLTDGTASYAPVERTVCEQVVHMLEAGQPVSAELEGGQRVWLESAVCVSPDDVSEGGPVADKPVS